jgi:hypothetical protein
MPTLNPLGSAAHVCRAGADCFFGSLLFDYDTVEWLRAQLTGVPVVLVFESALELMGQTRIGSFTMDPSGALIVHILGTRHFALVSSCQLCGRLLCACLLICTMCSPYRACGAGG